MPSRQLLLSDVEIHHRSEKLRNVSLTSYYLFVFRETILTQEGDSKEDIISELEPRSA